MAWIVGRWLVCVSVLVWVLPSYQASAQDVAMADQTDVIETREVVVSATKTPVPVTQLTSAVEVITEEDLKRRQVRTVADALRLAQGLTVFSSGGPGTTTSARIRGSNSDQVLVLIDGAIMNSGTTGSFDFANLTTDNIERIEILRGAQSMLWGSDAMGGVINITTKRGRSLPNVSGFSEYGSFNSIREGANLAGKKGPVDFSGSISRWDTTSFSAINYRRGASERDGYHNWQGSARLGVDLPKEGRLEFDFRWMNGITNFDGFEFPPPTFQLTPADVFGAKSQSKQYVYAGNYTQPITDWWSQKLTLSRTTENLTSSSGAISRELATGVTGPVGFPFKSLIETTSNRIEWQHNFQVGKPLLLTAGYQFRDQQGENRDLLTNNLDIPHKVLSSHAGFAQAQLNLWDRVFATAGVRQDEYNVFGSATTYRATAGYLHQETGTKVRGSYATGFRAPTFNQLYFPNFGNPNLKPEKSQSMDIGIDQYLFDNRLTLSGGFFWNHYRDMIVAQENNFSCGPFGFCAANIGAVSAKGWEASVKYAVVKDVPFIKSLDVQAQYTNTLTRNLDEQAGNRVPRIPVDQWSMIISYQPIDPLRINLEGRYVGSRFNDVNNLQSMRAFDVWNISAAYDVTNRVQTYLRVDNLFNEKYEEILFFGTPVRSIFAGLRVNYDVP